MCTYKNLERIVKKTISNPIGFKIAKKKIRPPPNLLKYATFKKPWFKVLAITKCLLINNLVKLTLEL